MTTQTLYYVGCSYFTPPLTIEKAFALLIEKDLAGNILGAFEKYEDACLAAESLSKYEGNPCPIIRFEVTTDRKLVYLEERGISWFDKSLKFTGKGYAVYPNDGARQLQIKHIQLKDASFEYGAAYKSSITFTEKFDSKTFSKELPTIRKAKNEAMQSRLEKEDPSEEEKETPTPAPKITESTSTVEVSAAPQALANPLADAPLAAAENHDSNKKRDSEIFIRDLEKHLETSKQDFQTKEELKQLNEKLANLNKENRKLKLKLESARERFLKILSNKQSHASRILTGILAFIFLSGTLSLASGLALTTSLLQVAIFVIITGTLLKVSKQAISLYGSLFNKEHERAEMEKLNETFTNLEFALSLDNGKDCLSLEIANVLENKTAEEKCKALLWLNPLLQQVVDGGSAALVMDKIKTRLKK